MKDWLIKFLGGCTRKEMGEMYNAHKDMIKHYEHLLATVPRRYLK